MIKIYLLGRFEISTNNRQTSLFFDKTKKGSQFLQYLLLKEEYIPSTELYKVLWPGNSIGNPESALKTLVFRTRTKLNRYDKQLGKCIVTDSGGYYWSDDFAYAVDIYLFEKRCRELLNVKDIDEVSLAAFEDALGLYVGDLGHGDEGGFLVVSRSAYYHTLYLRLAAHAVCLLKQKNHLEAIIRICRRVMRIDPYDEMIRLALTDALARTNQAREISL